MATSLAYAIDTLAFDLYVNHSSLLDQNVPTKTHPYLTMCIEPIVLASCLSEQRPNVKSIRDFQYEAFSATDEVKRSFLQPAKGVVERLFMALNRREM